MQVSAVPILDADRNVVEWVGMHTDITERMRSEEALRRAEKLALAGRMAMSISHEINNPLEAVTNILYLIGLDPTLKEESRAYVDTGLEELQRVSHLVSQTLRYAKSSSQLTQTDLRDIVDSALTVFQSRLIAAGTSIHRDYRTDATVAGYPHELRQVIANLISNAHDAMRRGGKLRIRIAKGQSWKTRISLGIRISIADNGTGISPEARRRLFEPFFTTKAETGTGLGLWVCSEIIARHGGEMSVRSSTTRGKSGTVFTIFLPFETVVEPPPSLNV